MVAAPCNPSGQSSPNGMLSASAIPVMHMCRCMSQLQKSVSAASRLDLKVTPRAARARAPLAHAPGCTAEWWCHLLRGFVAGRDQSTGTVWMGLELWSRLKTGGTDTGPGRDLNRQQATPP